MTTRSTTQSFGCHIGASLVLSGLACPPVLAQTVPAPVEAELETIIVEGETFESAFGPVGGYVADRSATATKTDIPLIESPQSVTVIGRESIEDRGADTLTEAVEYAPGVNTINSVNSAVTDSNLIQIRGFSAADATYRDGTRLFAGLPYGAPIEIYGLERIEVLRGPASILYGQGQPGGIINMVTKRPTIEPLREVGLQMGTFDHKQLTADVSDRLDADGNWRYRLTGLVQNSGTSIDYIKDDRVYIAPALTWTPTQSTELTLLARYQENQSDYYWTAFPRQGTKEPNNGRRIPRDRFIGQPGAGGYDSTVYEIGYLLEQRLGSVFTFNQNVRYRKVDYHVTDIFRNYFTANPFNEDLTTVERDARVRIDDGETVTADSRVVADFSHGAFEHSVLLGFDYKTLNYNSLNTGFGNADIPSINLYDPDYSQPYTLPREFTRRGTDANQYGLYLQDHIKFAEHWALTVGGRQDWVTEQSRNADENSQNELTWRAGLVYLADNGLAPYISYSESFVPQYGINEATGQGYDPITGDQYEAGLRYRPNDWDAAFQLAAYEINRENELVGLPNAAPGVQAQIGETRSRGIEASAELDLTDGLSAIASYTYNVVEVEEAGGSQTTNGNRIPERPDNLARLWLDYSFQQPLLDGLGIGAGVRYTSSAFADAANTIRTPSTTLVDGSVRYAFDGIELQVAGRNLFNEVKITCYGTQPTSFCSYGTPRTVLGSLTYRW